MKTKDYIEKYQPILYKTFQSAYLKGHLSHAYLLCGEPGTPLLKIAKYLAQTNVCDSNSGTPCEECRNCKKIEEEKYLDLKVIDGANLNNIKKDDVASIMTKFGQTAIERKGVQIYIINLIEIMRPEDEAVHSLLKFLEEPFPNVYAILTTNNIERVIPTIVSRCQVVQIRLRDRQSVIDEAINLGVNPRHAELLSKLYNDPDDIKAIISKEKNVKCINTLDSFLEAIEKGPEYAVFFNQKEVIPLIKDKETARFYLDLLSEIFREIIGYQNNLTRYLSNYDKIIESLSSRTTFPEEGLYLILDARSKIEINVVISLILDHLVINLMKGF